MTDQQSADKFKLSDRVNDVAENAYLKLGVRLFPAIIALVGWVIVHEIDSVEKAITALKSDDSIARTALWDAQRKTVTSVGELANSLAVLTKTVETNRERSDLADNRNSTAIDKMNQRLELLVTPLPRPRPN
jgi:hypothetical protein